MKKTILTTMVAVIMTSTAMADIIIDKNSPAYRSGENLAKLMLASSQANAEYIQEQIAIIKSVNGVSEGFILAEACQKAGFKKDVQDNDYITRNCLKVAQKLTASNTVKEIQEFDSNFAEYLGGQFQSKPSDLLVRQLDKMVP